MMNRILAVIFALVIALVPTSNVFAADDSPDSIAISNVKVFRNLAETDDVLILFHLSMPFATGNYSATPASKSIIFRVKDTDNVTVLQTGQPYVYPYFQSHGYGENMGSFYFASADNYTWNNATNIEVFTNALLTPARENSVTLTSSHYVTATTQDENRDLVAQYIFLECDGFETDYEDTGVILKTTSDVGLILSPYGEAYFRGVIPGLQDIVPDLFFIQTMIPEVMDVTAYDMATGDTYAGRLTGDDLGEGFNNLPGLVNMNKYAFWGLFLVLGTLVACVLTSRKGWGIEPGMLVGALGAICISLLVGDVIFGVIMMGSLLSAMGLVYIFILKRS